jgi:dipeptidyl aminopeptidase/acylaminoacyl peptidase
MSLANSDQILSIPTDGSATEPERVVATPSPAAPSDWSRDSDVILFQELRQLHLLHVTDRTSRRWLQTPFSDTEGRFSPDGQWLAYTSDQIGGAEVWVRPFPGPGKPVQVSSRGGHDAVWSVDGKEIFYRNGLKMLSARVLPGAAFRVDSPRVLFERGSYAPSTAARMYDVAPDGRFVMTENEPNDNTTRASIVVILNWSQELKARVPAK